jgi:hypothetical protein
MPSLSPGWVVVLVLVLGCEAPATKAEPVPAPAPAPAPVPAPGPVVAAPLQPPPEPAPAVTPWVSFASERWEFTAEFPGAVNSEVMSVPTVAGPIEMHLFSAESAGWAYMISALDGPVSSGPVKVAKVLDGARDGAVANVGGRLVSETQLEHAGLPARRIEVLARPPEGEQRVIGLLVLRERRMYQALVVAPSPAPELPAAADRFFAALKIAGK